MTPEDICHEVTADLGRPDLEAKALEVLFPAALRQVHSLANFRRDRTFCYLLSPNIHQGVISESLTAANVSLRFIEALQLYEGFNNGSGTIVPLQPIHTAKYVNADTTDEFDYYGFRVANTYNIVGDRIIIRGVPAVAQCVELQGLAYPTYTRDQITGYYSSNSWILQHYPSVIAAAVKVSVANIKQDAEARGIAIQAYTLDAQAFLNAFAQEIISWRSSL